MRGNSLIQAMCGIVAIGLTMFLPVRAMADEQPEVSPELRAALRRGDLRGALRIARTRAEAAPKNAVAQQVFGVLLVANEQIPEAEVAFADAFRAAPLMPPTASGLEDLSERGTALYAALNRQKAIFSVNAGAVAARNNLGAIKIIRNRADAGIDDLEAGSGLVPGWGALAANEAIGYIEKNRPEDAMNKGLEALRQGVETAKLYTTLADASLRQGKLSDALEYLKRSDQLDPDYAYALFVRSQLYRRTDRPRDAERALLQALALNPNVAAESRYVDSRNEFSGAGLNASADQLRFLSDGQPSTLDFRAGFEHTALKVDDRSDAYQRRYFAQGIVGKAAPRSDTTFYANYTNESGGWPGMISGALVPAATFGFDRADVGLLQGLLLGAGSHLMLHAGYRHNHDSVLTAPNQKSFSPLTDDQMILEARWDRAFSPNTALISGIAWLHNHRGMQMPADGDPFAGMSCAGPVEPNEQILEDGTSNLGTLYAFANRHLTNRLTLSAGPVLALAGNSIFAEPYFNARQMLTERYSLRFSILPRVTNAGADLYPIAALPDRPQEDPINRREIETSEYNRDPLIAGDKGRVLSYELGVSGTEKNGATQSVTAFHRRFNDMRALTEDPRLSVCLETTPVERGEASGLEAQRQQPISRSASLSASVRYQDSHVSSPNSGGIPNFAMWQGTLRFDWAGAPGWHVAVENLFVGDRPSSVSYGYPGYNGPSSSTEPSYALNLFVTHRMSNNLNLFLDVYQLAGNGTFYSGYPTSRYVFGGFTARY